MIAGKTVDQVIIGPMREIIEILNANDVADAASFRHLRGCHIAKANMPDQTLPLEVGQHCKGFFNLSFGWRRHIKHHAKIYDLERLETKMAQIVVHRLNEFLTREGR